LKPLKIYKYIIIFLIVSFLIFTISCSTTATTTTAAKITTTQIPTTTTSGSTTIVEQTTTTTTEAATTTTEANKAVEYQGVIIQPVTGLRFDNGIFFAEEGNPYGLEVGEKAGVFVKDAIEINGQMENSIALRPEVIEYLEKAEVEKGKWLQIPVPFDLTKKENKGIKMDFVKEEEWNTRYEKDALEQNFSSWHILAPIGSKMLSPNAIKASRKDNLGFGVTPSFPERNDFYETGFYTGHWGDSSGILYKGESLDSSIITVNAYGVKLEVTGEKINRAFLCSTYLSEPIFEVTAAPNANLEQRRMLKAPEVASFLIFNTLAKYNKNKDGFIFLFYGENMFLNLNNIKVSILPDESTTSSQN